MRILVSSRISSATICLFLAAPLLLGHAFAQKAQATYEEKKRQTNDIAVSIVVSGLSCTCARFAEDIRNVVNDLRPDGLRVLPVLGVGGLQNLNDVLFLKGADMGVVDEDNMRLLKKRDPQLYANIEQRVNYITKLYNSEFHVVARNDIKGYDDLRGQKVNFNLKDSQTEVTAEIVFKLLDIEVQRSNYDNDEAIKKLRDGEISAMIILSGAPQAALAKLRKEDGVHFLALDERSLPGRNTTAVFADYLPIELTHDEYPALIPQSATVPTIGNRALLVAYSWPENSVRYNRLARFVRDFFGKIDQFQDGARHPKWREINIAAEIPGWTRFKPAADWLAEHRKTIAVRDAMASTGSSDNLKQAFEQFMVEYIASKGQRTFSDSERELLFGRLQQFLAAQNRR
jgi:uncharacterized protein